MARVRRTVPSFGVDVIHLQHHGLRGILEALATLDLPYGYTVHDFNFACPTILFLGTDRMYCGAQTDAGFCTRCLAAQPSFAGIDIVAWRTRHRVLLARAAFLVAPSRFTAATLAKYYPDRAIDVIPHGAPGSWAMASEGSEDDDAHTTLPSSGRMLPLPDDGIPTVAILGAVGPTWRRSAARRVVRRRSQRPLVVSATDVQHGHGKATTGADGARSLRSARPAGAPRPLSGAPRGVPVGRPRDLQLHAVGGLGGRLSRRGASIRRARRAPRRHRCGLGVDRRRVARCCADARAHRRDRRGRACGRARSRRRSGRSVPRNPRWPSARSRTTMQRS